jgi:hypothetical protein
VACVDAATEPDAGAVADSGDGIDRRVHESAQDLLLGNLR